jgi:hypothetical protein
VLQQQGTQLLGVVLGQPVAGASKDLERCCCVAPAAGQSEVVWSAWDQIAKTSSSNATATRRFTGASTASS